MFNLPTTQCLSMEPNNVGTPVYLQYVWMDGTLNFLRIELDNQLGLVCVNHLLYGCGYQILEGYTKIFLKQSIHKHCPCTRIIQCSYLHWFYSWNIKTNTNRSYVFKVLWLHDFFVEFLLDILLIGVFGMDAGWFFSMWPSF